MNLRLKVESLAVDQARPKLYTRSRVGIRTALFGDETKSAIVPLTPMGECPARYPRQRPNTRNRTNPKAEYRSLFSVSKFSKHPMPIFILHALSHPRPRQSKVIAKADETKQPATSVRHAYHIPLVPRTPSPDRFPAHPHLASAQPASDPPLLRLGRRLRYPIRPSPPLP